MEKKILILDLSTDTGQVLAGIAQSQSCSLPQARAGPGVAASISAWSQQPQSQQQLQWVWIWGQRCRSGIRQQHGSRSDLPLLPRQDRTEARAAADAWTGLRSKALYTPCPWTEQAPKHRVSGGREGSW